MSSYNLMILVLLVLCGSVKGQKQRDVDLSRALKVGDSFTPPLAAKVMRGDVKEINWDKLYDKVVILDFFSTSCGTCIEEMPKLQRMQDEMKDRLHVFNVAYQGKNDLQRFFKANTFLKENNVNLSVIYGDTALKSLFPHWAEPHVVLIYKGRVQAITFTRLITSQNIERLYRNGSIDLPLKDDFKKGGLRTESTHAASGKELGVWISGYQDGVRRQELQVLEDSISGMVKSSFYNRSIYLALRNTWMLVKKPAYIPRPERVVWKVRDSLRYDNFEKTLEDWQVDNAISYERIDRIKYTDSIQGCHILNDLHSFYGIKSYYTTKRMRSLVLQPCNAIAKKGVLPKESNTYANSSVLATMLDIGNLFPPAVDMVNYSEPIVLASFRNIEELNEMLSIYGIEAVIEERDLEVFVIEEVL